MAIYIGNKHLTGTSEVSIAGVPSTVYIGAFQTYPEGQINYSFQNGAIHYSTGSTIYASGSNYAWYAADVLVYRGSTFISSAANVTLTATRISGDTGFHINANNEVYADNREDVVGSERTATFRASYGDTTAATFNVTQAENKMYTAQTTIGLTAYTEAFEVNGKYSYSAGTYYIPCYRQYDQWTGYTSGYMSSTSRTSSLVTAMTYLDTEYYSWLSTGTTQSGEGGYPRSLVVDENYSSGTGGIRIATIRVGYPVSGVWSDYDYVTTQVNIEQWGRPQNTYTYRIASFDISSDTWDASEYGTAYTHTITATSEYQITTWRDGATSSTGNWYTYTGIPEACGGEKPYAMMGSGYPYFYIRDLESGTTGYTGYLYYPTTSTTYGMIGVYPYQANSGTSARTQDIHISFGDVSTPLLLTQNANTSISISPSTITMPAASGETSAFTVTTQLSGWGASADTNWVTTSISGNKVNVTTVQDNISQAATQRTATIGVYYNGVVKATATVTQQADNYVFTALSVTAITLAATATSYSNLAVQSFAGYTPVPISNSNVSITNNNMNLGINGSVTSAGTGVYYVPLTCSTNTSTTTPKHATLTITQPGSGKQIAYSFTQTVADGTPAGVTKIADLGDGWILGTVWIANAGTSPNYEPVNMIVIVRKDATVSRTITLYGDYVTFPPPNHQRNVVTISPNPRTYSYSAGATFQLTSLDPSMSGTYTFHGINTTLTGVNAYVSLYTSPTPPEGMMYITIQ